MKWFFWTLVFLAFFIPTVFIGKGIDHLDIMKDRYKRALDAGANAAVEYTTYEHAGNLRELGTGFGEQEQHTNKIVIDKAAALTWFYRVFYRNLKLENDTAAQSNLKKYIPLKAIVSFDKIMIADLNDNWLVDKYYDIEYNGTLYRFTLSERVLKLSMGVWGKDIDFNIPPGTRQALVSEFVRNELNQFLNNRANFESNNYYDVNIAVADIDVKTDDVDGVNFIVMAEGLPLPTLNPWREGKFYAFGLGGSEITR